MDDVISQYTTKRFSLLRWMHLLPANFDSSEELTAYLMQRLEEDLKDAEAGQDSPVRAALWSLGFSRKPRSEAHTSELQSRFDLLCRLLHETNTTFNPIQPHE